MKKNWKTTLIALINLAALCFLLFLVAIDQIDSEGFVLILGGVNSAVVTILGFFTADIPEKRKTYRRSSAKPRKRTYQPRQKNNQE